jgi:hypothetical protein
MPILSAVAWVAGISLYLRYAGTTRGALAADLRDNVAGPVNDVEAARRNAAGHGRRASLRLSRDAVPT